MLPPLSRLTSGIIFTAIVSSAFLFNRPFHSSSSSSSSSSRKGSMNMNLSPLSPTLKDYVKMDISFAQKGNQVETPFDDGIVHFVVGGGRFFPEINDRALSSTIGETVTFTTKISDYQDTLSAEIPIENTPGGLQVGDIVKLSNGLKVRVTVVTDTTVTIDANPPLAGQNLDVTMKILERSPHTSLSQATFAAGCFWGLELAFMRLPGTFLLLSHLSMLLHPPFTHSLRPPDISSFLPLSVSHTLSLSFIPTPSPCLSLTPCHSPSFPLPLPVCLSHTLSLLHSHPLSLFVSHTVSLLHSHPLSLSLLFTLLHTHPPTHPPLLFQVWHSQQ